MIVVRPLPDGSIEELPPQDVTVGEGESALTIPWTNFSLWTNADARPHGLFIVQTPAPPPGKTRTSYSLAWNADQTAVEYRPVFEDQPEPPVTTITPRQMTLALLRCGKLDAVEAILNDPNLPREMKLSWNFATYFDRNDPMLLQMAAAEGWSEAEINQIFMLGATL